MSDFARVSKFTLLLSAFALFFLSFLMSGNGNALPQVFFQRYYPEQKTLLLSITLLSSTVAAIAGILVSRRVHARRFLVAALVLITVAIAEVLLSVKTVEHFIACLVLVQFADNFLLNQIDHAAVARSGELRGFNDGVGNAARLSGMLSAPAFFTVFADDNALKITVIGVLGVIAMGGCLRLFRVQPLPETKAQVSGRLSVPDRADWLVFGYAITVYSGLYLFAANMIYLLKDLFHIPGAETRGGIAIVTVFVFALGANGIAALVKRSTPETAGCSLKASALALPALALSLASGLILAGIKADYVLCLAASAVIGVCYGIFLWAVRDYSSRAARQGKTALLSWFNNMANMSALFAFGLMALLASGRSGTYYLSLMCAIAAVQAAGLVMLFFTAVLVRGSKRE